jgi:hypothetical protein
MRLILFTYASVFPVNVFITMSIQAVKLVAVWTFYINGSFVEEGLLNWIFQ